ncbi:MAG: hypothetical protein CVU73_10430 [Deltaproteobacteria bacterium HGW-Deltaproteobacteria-8]|jgi:hypothetical protein|nr:MAG: hypothetical protein CVU73_10430 [Deltaproteobacteria bacterium HGW-Deltaproteobacteria-8]
MLIRKYILAASRVLVLGLALGLGACASNTVVHLRYQPSTPPDGQVCAQSFTVLPFVDKRAETLTIGTLGDGKRYYAEDSPVEWISWAMFEELKARGCDVKYREKPDAAPLTGYVVSGSFDKINVDRAPSLTVKADLRLSVKLEKDGQFITENVYSGSREDLGVTMVQSAQTVLASTLQYLLQDAATNVVKVAK